MRAIDRHNLRASRVDDTDHRVAVQSGAKQQDFAVIDQRDIEAGPALFHLHGFTFH